MATVYEIITDRIIEQLEKGVVPWHKPWISDGTEMQNLVSKKPYRGINVFLLASRGYASPYWISFKQCKDLGGHIKAGEKSTPVIFWKQSKYVKEDETTGAQEEKTGWILRYYNVFNLEQAEDINPDKLPEPPPERDFDPIAECETVVKHMPKLPDLRHGESRAYYSPAKDLVNMPKRGLFDTAETYYATLFHELTHSTGHPSRLARAGVSGCGDWSAFGTAPYAKEELVAEMGSAFVCGHVGISPCILDNSAAYIASWLKRLRNDKQVLIVAAGQAQKAADFILGK